MSSIFRKPWRVKMTFISDLIIRRLLIASRHCHYILHLIAILSSYGCELLIGFIWNEFLVVNKSNYSPRKKSMLSFKYWQKSNCPTFKYNTLISNIWNTNFFSTLKFLIISFHTCRIFVDTLLILKWKYIWYFCAKPRRTCNFVENSEKQIINCMI